MASQEAGSSQSNSASRRAAGGEFMSLLKDVGASAPMPTIIPAADRNARNADGGANSKASIYPLFELYANEVVHAIVCV